MRKKQYNFQNKKIVFVDWMYIHAGRGNVPKDPNRRTDMMPYGVKLQNFKPKISINSVLKADKPWEKKFIGAYISAIQDEGKIKLYYEAYPEYNLSDNSTLFCYAESKDGIHFEKPNLNIVEWEGSTENNIMFKPDMHPNKMGIHGAGVFLDKNPNCPLEEKYKMIYASSSLKDHPGYAWGAISPDGIHWNLLKNSIAETWADTQTTCHWHPEKQKYVGFFRSWHYDRRQIYYSETENFANWPTPVPLITSDPTLGVDVDYYTNAFHMWPGAEDAYIMMPTMYRRTIDNLFVDMLISRDLQHWYKMKNNPIVKPAEQQEMFLGGQYMGSGIIDLGDGKWSIPVGVPEFFHNDLREGNPQTGLVHYATWREDGFTGLVVDEHGEFWTQPSMFKGNTLKINAWTYPKGSIQVELIDSFTRSPLPGFEMDKCSAISGTDIWHEVHWNNEEDLEDYDDVSVRLHFKITRGTIHAFKFE